MSKLYSPVKLGAIDLQHRVAFAPMTRLRAERPGDIPGDLMAAFYGQRASEGGLLIAEATPVSILGRGYLGTPGIYADEQIAGWRKVTDAVHAKGGKIVLQIWHVGRQSHVDMTGGRTPVAPSVVPFDQIVFTQNGWVPVSPHRALETNEISGIIEEFRLGAVRAKEAGFDGVEIHGANGYLLDQFLQDGTNQRTDRYGGSIENRARLLLEVTEAVVGVWGPGRVGVRVGPSGTWASMHDSNPEALFSYVAEELNRFDLAYLHVIEPRIKGDREIEDGRPPVAAAMLRQIFQGPIIAAGGFQREDAQATVERGDADLIAFGRFFSSNPDLPERLRLNLPLNDYDRDTFWGGDHRGYTDYPRYDEQHTAPKVAVPA